MQEQEKDVKIYYSKHDGENKRKDVRTTVDIMRFHRSVGNLDKAKTLGILLANCIIGKSDTLKIDVKDYLSPKFQSQDIIYQANVLLVFATEAVVHFEIPLTQLSTTILNSMYDQLRKEHPVFYQNISDGAAYSFYYLAIDKKGELTQNIGECFAMLCGVKNAEQLIADAEHLWLRQAQLVHEQIQDCEFMLL